MKVKNPNPHNLTFPYPQQGKIIRPVGQGCLSCVHQNYCPAVYWFKRYGYRNLEKYMGRACKEWTNDFTKQIMVWKQEDIDEMNYIAVQGIGSEANRNGITSSITAGDRR